MDRLDEYLKEGAAYDRLLHEYQKYGSLVIAVDFDSTIFDYFGKGESYEMVKQLVRDLHNIGCKIIIWSGTEDVPKISHYLEKQDIPYDAINENLVINGRWVDGKDSRKVYSNCLLDDRSGLLQVYNDLTRLVSEVKKRTFYRVCNEETKQGLWYQFDGSFTGLIHDKFNFCANRDLKMDFDEELVGWLSAVQNLEDLWKWFTQDDIKELQKHGWFIYEYIAKDSKFYDRFQHLVIKQDTSKVIRKIEL